MRKDAKELTGFSLGDLALDNAPRSRNGQDQDRSQFHRGALLWPWQLHGRQRLHGTLIPLFMESTASVLLEVLVKDSLVISFLEGAKYSSNEMQPGRFEIVIGTDVLGPLPRLFQSRYADARLRFNLPRCLL